MRKLIGIIMIICFLFVIGSGCGLKTSPKIPETQKTEKSS